MSTFNEDYPEFRNVNSGNASVDRIMRSYVAKDAARARDARARMQRQLDEEVAYQDSRRRDWETQRAMRDVRQRRSTNREIIDGRGSIDSRAFNEKNELVGYTIDERDRHDPMLDTNESKSRWRSQDGHRSAYQKMPMSGVSRHTVLPTQIGLQGGSMGSKRNFAASGQASGFPLLIKIAIPLIVLGVVILVVLINS